MDPAMSQHDCIMQAIDNNNFEEVRKIIGLSYSSEWREKSTSHLVESIKCGHSKITEFLLNCGAKVDSENSSDFDSPLICAILKNDSKTVKLLLQKNAEVNITSTCGGNALFCSLKEGNLSIAELLLNYNANIDVAFRYAVRQGEEGIVKYLLEHGVNVDILDEYGIPLLFTAIQYDRGTIVKILLENGANVNAEDNQGKTILYFAVEGGNQIIIEQVLKFCPDPTNIYNKKSLNVALCPQTRTRICANSTTIVAKLVAYGFTIDWEQTNDYNLLDEAIHVGCLKIVEDFLKCRPVVNIPYQSKFSSTSWTLLHCAINLKREEIARLLINYGADVNIQHAHLDTPVVCALKMGNFKMMKLLLNSGANLIITSSIFNSGVRTNSKEIVEFLLLHDPDIDINAEDACGNTALECALRICDIDIVKVLLNAGAIVSGLRFFNYETVLHYVVQHRDIEFTNILLQHNADINYKNTDGETALYYAIQYRDIEHTKLLLHHNADTNSRNNYGETVLHYTVQYRHVEHCKILLQYNADANAKNNFGETALHYAIEHTNDIEYVMVLLQHNADINSKNNDGETPLHYAIEHTNDIEHVRVLLQHNADINSRNNEGETALHYAALYRDDIEYSKILIQHNADINSKNYEGETALHYAVKYGFVDVIQILLNYNADINITSNENFTPLDLFNNDASLEGSEYIKQHIIKMKIAHLYVSEQNLSGLGNYSNPKIQRDCQEEISEMRNEKISYYNITFYHVLTKHVNQIAKYARNEDIVKVFEIGDYKTKFPIYNNLIEINFRKGVKRAPLLSPSIKSFNILSAQLLPNTFTEELLFYLSDKDLENLIEAANY